MASKNPQIIFTGSFIDIDTISLSLVQGPTQLGVTVDIEYPEGTVYSSHTASAGSSFDGTTWTIVSISTVSEPYTLDIEIEVTDVDLFTSSERIVLGIATPLVGEAALDNNEIEKEIVNIITCTELEPCFGSYNPTYTPASYTPTYTPTYTPASYTPTYTPTYAPTYTPT